MIVRNGVTESKITELSQGPKRREVLERGTKLTAQAHEGKEGERELVVEGLALGKNDSKNAVPDGLKGVKDGCEFVQNLLVEGWQVVEGILGGEVDAKASTLGVLLKVGVLQKGEKFLKTRLTLLGVDGLQIQVDLEAVGEVNVLEEVLGDLFVDKVQVAGQFGQTVRVERVATVRSVWDEALRNVAIEARRRDNPVKLFLITAFARPDVFVDLLSNVGQGPNVAKAINLVGTEQLHKRRGRGWRSVIGAGGGVSPRGGRSRRSHHLHTENVSKIDTRCLE